MIRIGFYFSDNMGFIVYFFTMYCTWPSVNKPVLNIFKRYLFYDDLKHTTYNIIYSCQFDLLVLMYFVFTDWRLSHL